MLSHHQSTENGDSSFIEHGRLVKVGDTLGKLKRRPKQLVALFSYESPKRKGYESLPQTDHDASKLEEAAGIQNGTHTSVPPESTRLGREDEMVTMTIPVKFRDSGLGKTTLDVMGICCPNEVPLIKKLLQPIPGVEEVSVNVTSKTVTVLHDQFLVTDADLGT
jgi:Cd2+/Zn2+-exporting ATPase